MAKTFSFSHAILKDLKRRKMDSCFKKRPVSETRVGEMDTCFKKRYDSHKKRRYRASLIIILIYIYFSFNSLLIRFIKSFLESSNEKLVSSAPFVLSSVFATLYILSS